MSNPNFTKISEQYLPTLDITLEEYRHNRTHAMHYHFASKNSENVFMVALRTMPHNSTGVAHILEHTALCGSENFQIRDPFFGMLKRSVQTFMNAFTSSDWTAYPFATENPQDFDNLLRVYLDAVFFPNLSELDFMQEWHRFDFDENNNIVIKGVVYNEMKGVYGNVFERLYEINKSLLHGETTYHYDSGGAPQVIPSLTYEEFKNFHKKHYHPTNATFFTFGNISAEHHQNRFEELALKNFDNIGEKVTTVDETRFLSPIKTNLEYPSTDSENPFQTHVLFSWLLESASNAKSHLEADLVYSYLLAHSGSPLRYALENYEHAESVSPLTMLDDSGREIRFMTGIVTDNAKYADEVENLIFETLNKVIENGVPTEEVIGIIDQIETSLRELSTGYPYGLSLFLQSIGAATHGENMAAMLDPSDLLDELRENAKDPFFLSKIIENLLVKNPHRTRLVATPSAKSAERELDLEKNFCEKKLAKMSEVEKNQIRENAKKLDEHQKIPQNLDLLPKIELFDIPREAKKLPQKTEVSPFKWQYSVATNKLEYYKNYFEIDEISLDEIPDFALALGLVGELGFAWNSYSEAQKKISAKMSFSGNFKIFNTYDNSGLRAQFAASARYLERNRDDAKKLFSEIISSPRFDEAEQIDTILSERLLGLKSSLTSSGNATAMLRASSGHTLLASLSEKMSGISSLETLKNFQEMDKKEMQEKFAKIFKKTTQNSPLEVIISSEKISESSSKNLQKFGENPLTIKNADFVEHRKNEAWIADLAVGYCAYSVKTVPGNHEDAPLLTLLAQFLRDGYLHSAIREQGGAYGAGAKYDPAAESFNFFSYRDPRIEGTFVDFEKSITWLLENNHDEERLSEAKIGVIARADVPKSPAAEAQSDVSASFSRITREDENRVRGIILDATIDDLKKLAKKYFSNFREASRVVITGKQNRSECEKLGFEIKEL